VTCPRTSTVGAYVLGALEPGEHAEFATHLEHCGNCHTEFDRLAALPRVLSCLSLEEVERLGAPDGAEVTRRLVQLYEQRWGVGPATAQSYVKGDVLTCVLEGGFSRMEQSLLDWGRGAVVQRTRDKLYRGLRGQHVSAVEQVVGRPVRTCVAATDDASQTTVLTFVFERG
jgi:uncharacterized protein YbcI